MNLKRILTVGVTLLALAQVSRAQTNLQLQYGFGPDTPPGIAATLEGEYNDVIGSTTFYVDYVQSFAKGAKPGVYVELARCLNFWQETPLSFLSLHMEYDGGALYRRPAS